ncbi:hypothetical protein UPYG_G00140760 [Umbra pygmaea]|uniref:protein-tyrosine-phosphatase n=1 Tax=Umbra pygmaea TaxID=75934 RepID=A0ABD0WZK7_UMBPY
MGKAKSRNDLCIKCKSRKWRAANLTTNATIPPSTIPNNVESVNVTGQNETSVTVQWNNVTGDGYLLKFSNGTTVNITDNSAIVIYTISNLEAGKIYNITLITVLGNNNSSGHNFPIITAPCNVAEVKVTEQSETSVTVQWNNVKGDGLSYELRFSNMTIPDINMTIPPPDTSKPVTCTVSSLKSGRKYIITLFTVFEGIRSSGLTNVSLITRPLNVPGVNVTGQNETSITLQWNNMVDLTMLTYALQINNGTNTTIIVHGTDEYVTYTVQNLTGGKKYNLTLFTVFENVTSTGKEISTVTAPYNVENVNVTNRSETSVTLEWKRPANGITSYQLNYSNTSLQIANASTDTYTVVSLTNGTQYELFFFTVFEGIKSSGVSTLTVTKMFCSNLPWVVTNTSIQAKVNLEVNFGHATNGSQPGDSIKTNVIHGQLSFTNLNPGATYQMTLWFKKESIQLPLCEHMETLVPPDLIGPTCHYLSGGYAFSLSWGNVEGIWTSVEVNVSGHSPHRVNGSNVKTAEITGVQPAKTYPVTLALISGPHISNVVSFSCQTDPRGVIAGSVMAALLFCILVLLAFFIWRRKPEMFSRPKSVFVESKLCRDKFRAIPLGKFPDHYKILSSDTYRGFSEEYEDFESVGKEQAQRAADLVENRSKNRFTNVLPYDWSRVKLTVLKNDTSTDYINANYMPGYDNNRQYIAAQGPLPNTVNDFWRMIWEQRVKGVVMVTNCTEGGRVKCEQYWPLDYTPCLYGDLLVTVRLEMKETDWTHREFVVKNKKTSEERLVEHFHFTSWPDHGVPEGTEALIRFRRLVRQHIEHQQDSGPTVVHCSAGVGRTGTLIALDVILQQLEREKAVSIAAFVHKIRLSRPLMVQTESQYIFLHQCIMDSLQPKDLSQEPLYENTDMIYANATALRDFHATNTPA